MNNGIKIVHAVRSNGFAGVERHIAVLARAQASRGDQVVVIGGNRERMSAALDGAPVRFLAGETLPRVVQALIREIAEADVLHVHMTAAEAAAVLVSLGPVPRVPIVTTRHFAGRRGQSRLGRIAAKFIGVRIASQIAISHYVAGQIEGESKVVHPGVETVDFGGPRDPVALVVQRLEPEKRTDVAIMAFAYSRLAEDGWRLRIAGDGSLRSDLEDRARELGVSHAVDFLGMRSDIAQLMATSSLLLAPCPIEGLGLGVLEAMAASLPVVASAAGGHLETLPPEAQAFCFRNSDALAAATALNRIAQDPELRGQLACAGLRRQQAHFTPTAQAEATAAVYRAVMNGHGG